MRELVKLETRRFPLILGILLGVGGMILGGPGLAIELYSNVSTESQLASSLLNKEMRNGVIVDLPDGDSYRDLLVTFNNEAVKAFQGTTCYSGRPTFMRSKTEHHGFTRG